MRMMSTWAGWGGAGARDCSHMREGKAAQHIVSVLATFGPLALMMMMMGRLENI